MVTVTIMCKPYVAFYLVKNFGNPVRIPRKSNIRYTFLSCIQKDFADHYNNRVKALEKPVEVHLNEKDLKTHGSSIMPGMMYFVNKLFEERIKNELFLQINLYIYDHQLSIKAAIRKYQEENGFDESVYPFDSIEKTYHRMKKDALKKGNNCPQITNEKQS